MFIEVLVLGNTPKLLSETLAGSARSLDICSLFVPLSGRFRNPNPTERGDHMLMGEAGVKNITLDSQSSHFLNSTRPAIFNGGSGVLGFDLEIRAWTLNVSIQPRTTREQPRDPPHLESLP